jgi:regulator of RNase E activity RraA
VNTEWRNDEQLFAAARRELFTAVVGDILDQMGLLHQFLPPQIRPLSEDMVVLGRAMPVLEADAVSGGAPAESASNSESGAVGRNPSIAEPFGLMLSALDDLKPGEVYLCSGASPEYALWGELMSTRAGMLGAAGAVLVGYTRDTRGIRALGFPTFAFGSYAQDQGPRGKVVDFRVPLAVGAVRVEPGDIVFGDIDGVLVVPRAAEEEAFTRAFEKARGEKRVQRAIQEGMSASEAFRTFGIM